MSANRFLEGRSPHGLGVGRCAFQGLLALGVTALAHAADLAKGRALFEQQCQACHALTADGFGPPLGGVTSLLAEERLVAWVRDPAGMLASGDARASALLARYKVQMPAFAHLAPTEVSAIVAFIREETTKQGLQPFAVEASVAKSGPLRLLPPIPKSGLVIELEDYVQIPRLPGRTAYKGITLLRPDPREAGALFVDELMGILYRVTNRRPAVFLDVRPYFPEFMCDPGVASGLGSFALHPDFVRNGIFYTTHSELRHGSAAVNASDIPADVPKYETPPLEFVLTEWKMTDPAAAVFAGTHREVMRFVTPTTGHGSQEIAFSPVTDPGDPDYAKLYIGIGDGGSTNLKRPDMSGHPHTFLGSILRIDPRGANGANGRYGIPADNPFAATDDPGVRREIWAYGFRNPHRFSWDLAPDRRMYAVDIGESNIEEVNVITPGGAYGYGVAGLEGTFKLDARADAKVVRAATSKELSAYLLPWVEYDHNDGTAVTGGYVYRGPLPALREKYVFGDIVNGRIFCVNRAGLGEPKLEEIDLVRDGELTTVKKLAHAERAHLRFGYDDRTGDLFLLTKDDGMIRRVVKAYSP